VCTHTQEGNSYKPNTPEVNPTTNSSDVEAVEPAEDEICLPRYKAQHVIFWFCVVCCVGMCVVVVCLFARCACVCVCVCVYVCVCMCVYVCMYEMYVCVCVCEYLTRALNIIIFVMLIVMCSCK